MKKNPLLSGFVTLMAVIVMGAVSIIITVSVLLLGIDASRTSFANEQSNQAKALANLCMEDALQTINDTTNFSGTVNKSAGAGSCSYTVTDLGTENRTVIASGTVSSVVRKISVSINDINPIISITSWQEIP